MSQHSPTEICFSSILHINYILTNSLYVCLKAKYSHWFCMSYINHISAFVTDLSVRYMYLYIIVQQEYLIWFVFHWSLWESLRLEVEASRRLMCHEKRDIQSYIN